MLTAYCARPYPLKSKASKCRAAFTLVWVLRALRSPSSVLAKKKKKSRDLTVTANRLTWQWSRFKCYEWVHMFSPHLDFLRVNGRTNEWKNSTGRTSLEKKLKKKKRLDKRDLPPKKCKITSAWIQRGEGRGTAHTATQVTACTHGPLCILIAKWMIWDYPSWNVIVLEGDKDILWSLWDLIYCHLCEENRSGALAKTQPPAPPSSPNGSH